MRLIDADALEPDTEWSEYEDGFVSYSQMQIDTAPTIEPEIIEAKAYVKGIDDERKRLADAWVQPKRGEWIDAPLYFTTFQGTVNDGYTYCSCCRKKFDYGHRRNFCDECGADMRSKIVGKHADFMMIDEACVKGADDE